MRFDIFISFHGGDKIPNIKGEAGRMRYFIKHTLLSKLTDKWKSRFGVAPNIFFDECEGVGNLDAFLTRGILCTQV